MANPIPKSEDTISAEEWELAKAFFGKNPSETKFFRKADPRFKKSQSFLEAENNGDEIAHSFVKLGGEIYAISRTKALGEGAYGRVKRLYDEEGNLFVVKKQLGKKNALAPEVDVLKSLGQKAEVGEQKRSKPKKVGIGRGKTYKEQSYMLNEFVPGTSLLDALKNNDYSEEEKLSIAIQCAEQIKALRDLGEGRYHGDVAARNFMIDENNQVRIIDFGNAIKLKGNKGNRQAVIPIEEFKHGGRTNDTNLWALLSPDDEGNVTVHENLDVYSLFDILANDLDLPIEAIGLSNMDSQSSDARPSIDDVLERLTSYQLANMPDAEQPVSDTTHFDEEFEAAEMEGGLASTLGFDLSGLNMPGDESPAPGSPASSDRLADTLGFDLTDIKMPGEDSIGSEDAEMEPEPSLTEAQIRFFESYADVIVKLDSIEQDIQTKELHPDNKFVVPQALDALQKEQARLATTKQQLTKFYDADPLSGKDAYRDYFILQAKTKELSKVNLMLEGIDKQITALGPLKQLTSTGRKQYSNLVSAKRDLNLRQTDLQSAVASYNPDLLRKMDPDLKTTSGPHKMPLRDLQQTPDTRSGSKRGKPTTPSTSQQENASPPSKRKR